MPRPTKASLTGASVTEGGFKTALDGLIDWLDILLGAVDDYIRLVRGTTASRPAATEGGWLRWNTDRTELEMSYGTSWQQLVRSTVDATWKINFQTDQSSGCRFINTLGTDQKIQVEGTNGSVILGVNTSEAQVSSSGTRPVCIYINAVKVLSVDSSGNVIALGNITANGTP